MSGISERNPYVGPRSIQQGETLYGRDKETLELYEQLQARRIVVLHSPSGAGKSSLVQAGLIPKLEHERFDVWRPIRLNLDPTGLPGVPATTNRYLLSAMSSLEQELPEDKQRTPAQLAKLDLAEYLETRPRRKKQLGRPVVLLFDQFEEVLTVAPRAVELKRELFSILGNALANERYWALFIIREDHLAAFSPYRDRLPTQMDNTFRLDLLGLEGAREAAARSALAGGRTFPAVDRLIQDLSLVQVQQADGSLVAERGIHVEPVQLQVVCRRLWAAMPKDDTSIEAHHIEQHASVSESLAGYYAQSVEAVAKGDVAQERAIREWVGEMLVVDGIRSQVRQGPSRSGGLDNASIEALLDTYLVRTEQRAGASWFELSHDRLIEPVLQDNERWEREHLHSVQVQAKLWVNGQRSSALLLSAEVLLEAEAWAAQSPVSTEDEREYVRLSRELRRAEQRQQRAARNRRIAWTSGLSLLLVATAVVAIVVIDKNEEISRQKAEVEDKAEQLEHEKRAQRDLLSAQRGLRATMLIPDNREAEALLLAVQAVGAFGPTWTEPVPQDAREGLEQVLANDAVIVRRSTILEGHQEPIYALAYSPDGTRLVTASFDGTAKVWEPAAGRLLGTLEGHEDRVVAVSVSPDGSRIATAGWDTTARLWSTDTLAPEHVLEGHEGPVDMLAFAPDGTRIATASRTTARVWDAATGKLLSVLQGHVDIIRAVVYSPDGSRIVTAGWDKSARVWDAVTGEPLLVLEGHDDAITAAAYSPDGSQIATASREANARVWDASSGTLRAKLLGHDEELFAVVYSPDGSQIATASMDGSARLWAAETGELMAILDGHEKSVYTVAYSPSGEHLVTASKDQTARVWDASTGMLLATLEGHEALVRSACVSPAGTQIASAGYDHDARVWELPGARVPFTQAGHADDVYGLVYSPDGSRIATASLDGTTRLWDSRSGQWLETLATHGGKVKLVEYSPDGSRIATATEKGVAQIWDASTGALLWRLEGHRGEIHGLAYSPRGDRLATASKDGKARVWNVETGECTAVLEGHENSVLTIRYSPDGAQLATGSFDRSARLWDAVTGALLATLEGHDDYVYSVSYSPDGARLATASDDGTARLWNTSTGALLTTLSGHQDKVRLVSYAPEGGRVATASDDGTVRIWDASTGALLATLSGHEGRIHAMIWSRDEALVATAGEDTTARIWRPTTGELVHTLRGHRGEITEVAFSPDGLHVATASEDDTARVWDVASGEIMTRLEDRVVRARSDGSIEWPLPPRALTRLGCERLRPFEDEYRQAAEVCDAVLGRD